MNITTEPSLPSNKRNQIPLGKMIRQGLVPAAIVLWAVASVSAQAHQLGKDAHAETAAAKKVAPNPGAKLGLGRSPVTVFIDGPSGFVYVFTAEGWKFVGRRDTSQL